MTTKLIKCSIFIIGVTALISAQATDLYFSASGSGYSYWDDVSGWKMYNTGGQLYGQLPTTNDNVNINAATLAAEDGKALCVTNGVFAECNTMATGEADFSGSAYFRLEGGSLTCRTDFVTGFKHPGLATLESGDLYGGGTFYVGLADQTTGYGTVTNNGATVDFNTFVLADETATSPSTLVQTNGSMTSRGAWYIGNRGDALMEINGGSVYSESEIVAGHLSGSSGTLVLNGGSITGNSWSAIGKYGQGLAVLNTGILHSAGNLYIGMYGGSSGVVTNNGAEVSAENIRVGYESGTYGKLVHNSGTLDADSYLLIGRNGGVSEFEVNAPFSADIMIIGSGLAPDVPGTGTVTVAENAVGTIDEYLRINNGELYMKGGEIHLQNVGNPNVTNLYVRKGADRYGKIQGWGSFTNVNEAITLRMVNDGQIIADGEGVERDLNLNQFAVVDNHLINGPTGTNGWYAINKGRVLFPRTWQTYNPGTTYCWGDYYKKSVPEMVNSVAFSPSATFNAAIRGGFCASDRNDIPSGLPEGALRPIGIWCIGAYTGKLLLTQASFDSVYLTFRYDHTKIQPTDYKLRLYRYDGSSWNKVGECYPNSNSLIATDTALSSVSTGDYNIGWFAVMVVELNGTVIMVK